MLQNRLTTPLSSAEQQEAVHLLRELSHLPLAVAQAAACMNASGMTVQQYRAQLDEHGEAALEYSDDLSEGKLREYSLRKAVAAALSLSMDQVRQSNAVAVEYLFLAACVDRKDISLDLLEASSPQAREDAIKVLDRYALVTRRPAESALDVHRLVHQALREQLQLREGLQEWSQRATTQLLQAFPDDDHSNRSKWRRLLPHAQYVLSHSERNDDKERSDLAQKCAMALNSDGQYKRSEELFVQVIETRKRVLGREHPNTLTSMSNLAGVLNRQGKYKEAEATNRQTLAYREKVLGREHPNTLTSMSNLAGILDSQGKYEEAEAINRQTLAYKEKVLGREHPDTLTSMSNLALVLDRQGKYEEAEATNRQTLAYREKVLGREHPDTLTSVYCLAYLLAKQHEYKESLALYKRACDGYSVVLGERHPTTCACRQHYSEVLALQEQS